MRNCGRPGVLVAVGAALAAVAFVSLLVLGEPQARGQPPPLSEDEAALLVLINDYRLQHGLSALKVSPTLAPAARWMSEDMAEHDRLRHTDSLGRSASERMAAFGYTQASLWGEIIRGGASTPQGAFEAWRDSPAHNAIMLTDGFAVAGVGKAYNPQSLYGWFWTVDFGDYDDSLAAWPTPSPTPIPTAMLTRTPTPTPGPGQQVLGRATGPSSSQAQDGALRNCPQPGKWAISVWDGADGTDTGQALATCGEGAVAVAYYIDPYTQLWSRWFVGWPEVSDLQALNDMEGIIALGADSAP